MPHTEKLKAVFAKTTGIKPELVHAETKLSDAEIYDSLLHVETVIAVEEAFGISIDDDEVEKATTFNDFSRLVTKKMVHL